jgi:WD40 repeat protein
MEHFSGRTRGSLQVRYSSKVKHRKREPANPQPLDVQQRGVPRPEAEAPATFATLATLKPQSSGVQKRQFTRLEAEAPSENRKSATSRTLSLGVQGKSSSRLEAEAPSEYVAPSRRNLKVAPRTDGFVSWAEIKALRKEENAAGKSATPIPVPEASLQTPGLGLDVAHPASISRILRSRELGNTARRNWSSNSRLGVSDELQNHILDTLGPRRYFHGASRDVTCVAWAGDGNQFAAGAIAIDDERSMQYNRPNNLLLGDVERNSLQELPEHHVARPTVSDSRNVNSLRAMQETQDPRLFKTVAAVGFSEDSKKLYSAGSDGVVRMYDTSGGSCLSSVKQEAEVALLTMNSKGLLASGSHRPDDGSISVLRSYDDRLEAVCQLGPSRADAESSLPIYPSALKWGAGIYSHLLLAGFASDSYDDDRLAAGEIFLWDSTVGQKIGLPTARNVFDVAWNPFPSSGASLFAVAGARHGRRYRSTIQCFAPNQGRASRVLEWDCPAFDINDLVYCPHDDNLIAAGATDGKVYIWDKRAANRSQAPLHILSHDQTKNVLDHDRDLEIADTGVRFLSWSATGNRLYSGSSDGVVKVWNPYRATQDAHVKDVASFNSAVMSGAFSPDYRDLLIGEDASHLNLLGIDREDRKARAAKKFEYFPAPAPVVEEDKFATARELLATEQLEVRPMGNLPIKQVVQGRKYKGPFLAPSDDFVSDLDAQHQLALRKQRELRTRLPGGQLDQKTKDAVELVDRQVLMFQQALQVARQKWEDHRTLEPAALLLQKTFRDTEELAVHLNKSCSLDCNYLPAAGDEDGEAPDNRRSEQRIPGKLRLQHQVQDTADMTNAEIEDAGLTGKCSACMGPAAKSKRGLAICEKCSLIRSGLTARCEKCAAPVRPNLDERVKRNVCERCKFQCFRCGGIATVSPTCDTITCEPCNTQWEAGVLGYEVKGAHSPSRRMRDWKHEQDMESLDQRMGRLFGEDEMERLAGRFHA